MKQPFLKKQLSSLINLNNEKQEFSRIYPNSIAASFLYILLIMSNFGRENLKSDSPEGLPPLSFNQINYWENALNRAVNGQPDPQIQLQIESPVIDTNLGQIPKKLIRKKTLARTLKQRLKEKKMKRVSQNMLVYLISLLMVLSMGTENLYIFLSDNDWVQIFVYFPSLIFKVCFFIGQSYYLSRDCKVMGKLFFGFDRVLASAIATAISIDMYCAMEAEQYRYPWVYYSRIVLSPFEVISYTGYLRVIIIFSDWKSWQTILTKIAITIGGASYFGLGMYFTISSQAFKHDDQMKSQILRSLIFLYAFAGFDLQIEAFSMFDQFDGTNKFRGNYSLTSNQQDEEYLFFGRKLPSLPKHKKQVSPMYSSPLYDMTPEIQPQTI